MTDITPKFHRLLLELELLSDGATTSWNSSNTAHAKPGTKDPTGDSRPPHILYRIAYEASSLDRPMHTHDRAGELFDTWADRTKMTGDLALHPDDVQRLAQEELRQWRGQGIDRSKVKEETRQERDERILTHDGFSAREVAIAINGSEREVRKARMAGQRNPDTGKRLPNAKVQQRDGGRFVAHDDLEDRRRRTTELKEAGHSVRQIAMILGVSVGTVDGDLKKAA